MTSLRQLISTSTGLKITYAGFAAYAIYTLVKFYVPAADLSNILTTIICFLGPLGLIAAILSMIVTGVRGIRRVGLKSWWSLWALLGIAPFIVTAISILSFSMLVNAEKPFIKNLMNDNTLQLMENKIVELKRKKADPKLISNVTKMYARDTYFYKGDIIEYVDEKGTPIKYRPTDKEIQQRRDLKDLPQKVEEAQTNRLLEVVFWFAIPLLTVVASFLIPMKREI